jgi:predicted nucleic acid-binding protein
MKVIFADTSYWVAMIDHKDQWHDRAAAISKSLANDLLLTTDEVLTEVLAFFSAFDPRMRQYVSDFVIDLLMNQNYVEVVEQTARPFLRALRFTSGGQTNPIAWWTAFPCNS